VLANTIDGWHGASSIDTEIQRLGVLCKASQHSVHPAGGSLRVFKQFAWLGLDSGKMALSRPAHQRVTQVVILHSL